MKRGLILSIVGVFLLACGLYAYVAWGKAHVPLDRVQICDEDGGVKNMKAKKYQDRLIGRVTD